MSQNILVAISELIQLRNAGINQIHKKLIVTQFIISKYDPLSSFEAGSALEVAVL